MFNNAQVLGWLPHIDSNVYYPESSSLLSPNWKLILPIPLSKYIFFRNKLNILFFLDSYYLYHSLLLPYIIFSNIHRFKGLLAASSLGPDAIDSCDTSGVVSSAGGTHSGRLSDTGSSTWDLVKDVSSSDTGGGDSLFCKQIIKRYIARSWGV